MRLYRLLKKPIVTEKTSNMSLQKNVYVFEVSLDATKIDIKIYPKNASLKDVNFIVETSGIKVDSFGKVKGIIPGKYRIRVEVKNCPSYILNIEVR